MTTKNNIPAGYKESAVGIIPQEWCVFDFGDIAYVSKEKYTPTKSSHIACVELEHLSQGDGVLLEYTEAGLQKSTKNIFKKGSILFGKLRPYLRKYWLATFEGVCSSEIWVLNTNEEVCIKEYLYRLISSERFIQFANVSIGSKMPRADWDFVSLTPFSIPPMAEQRKIAEILGVWDEAIEKQSRLIEKLELRKRALMQRLLTGRTRLPGFTAPWQKVKVGEIGKRIIRRNEENNQNVMTISAQRGFVRQTDFFNKNVASENLDNYYLVYRDEFCYNKSYSNGYPMGAIKRLKEADKAVVTTLYICFCLNCSVKVDIDFFEQYCENGGFNQNLMKVANEGGRAHGLLNVTPSDFFGLQLLLPYLPEQKAIAEVLTSADNEIATHRKKLDALRLQKRGLMQQLLTGKTRVKI